MEHVLDLAHSTLEVLVELGIPEETAEELLSFAINYCKDRGDTIEKVN